MLNKVETTEDIKKMNVKEIGTINISVFLEESSKFPVYHILSDKEEFTPIVNLLDFILTENSFKFSEEFQS